MIFAHKSVLLWECIDGLDIKPNGIYVDCTAGGGGHSLEIAKRMGKNSRLICFDRDKNAIKAATEDGILGLFTGIFDLSSSGISFAVFSAFLRFAPSMEPRVFSAIATNALNPKIKAEIVRIVLS